MLDINFIRANHEILKTNLKKRGQNEKIPWVDDLIKKDAEWRKLKKEADALRHKRNVISGKINLLKKEKKDISKELTIAKKLPKKIKETEGKATKLEKKLQDYLMLLPNILHPAVPLGKDETENKEIRRHGKIPKFKFKLQHHGALAEKLDLIDFKRAAKISGVGFSFLKKELALMDQAVMRFALDEMLKKGFSLIAPPFMMRRLPYEGVTDYADFENVMYKVENEDLYLIATSEHPIAAMFMNEILEEKDLPIKFCGISPCFRKEIGKHSVDERGLFRVHQFNKVEQFIFCRPEESEKLHLELLKNSEELLKKLKIPYRVVDVCTGDIGTVASRKYDIEAWSPRENKYIEVVSCSNCTDYQANRLNIRYRKNQEKFSVHTLNNTALASPRILRVIIENYQTKKGTIKIPTALQPYMHRLKEIK